MSRASYQALAIGLQTRCFTRYSYILQQLVGVARIKCSKIKFVFFSKLNLFFFASQGSIHYRLLQIYLGRVVKHCTRVSKR